MRVPYSSRITSLVLILVLLSPAVSQVQMVKPDLLKNRWKATWITYPDGPRRDFGVFHFRKTFTLDSVPTRFVVHASGDNRYELYVNGARVLTGPARGDLYHWRYETLDIAPHLRAGKNSLAAVVWNFAGLAPLAQMTHETGLIVQGDGEAEAVVNTDKTWKSFSSSAVEMVPIDRKIPGYFAAGPGELLDGTKHVWGWEQTDYDDSAWKPALQLSVGGPRGVQDSPSRWMLVPRTIPLMEEKVERLVRIVRANGLSASPEFLQGRAPITVPANMHATLLLDHSFLTTAYPELVTRGGRSAEIKVTYAEALVRSPPKGVRNDFDKGNRNETEGKEILGFHDRFISDGGEHRLFRPLWWRTFRYMQIDVDTHAEPLVIEDLRAVFTAYPFSMRATFESDDPALKKMWNIGWRTARLCAHETYMDCPYYEQLQYGGDTRIQALISLYMTGDNRMVKNAIELLNESQTPEGLIQSRYPSFLPQYIPPFALLWIGMMRDLWWYHGETEFLREFLPNSRNVLGWFESRLDPSGLLGQLEWWNFVDWTKDFRSGVPPQESGGQSAILSLQFAAALRDAADLEANFGLAERAQHYRLLATKVTEAVRRTCWDASRHLIADTPARQHFSQHANILAVLTDTIPATEQRSVMRTVLNDQKLTQCSYYFRFYLFRAMNKAGLGDEYIDQLGPWREMLALGLTTWAEKPEPTRSDCHAWSAHPNFDLLATVAGIEPSAPGFREVAIRPHLSRLERVKATLPHPQGEISVEYRRRGQRLTADVSLPGKLTGWFHWQGKRLPLHSGQQRLAL